MSRYALRLPNSLFEHAKNVANKENTSLNQLFITAIAEKISALETVHIPVFPPTHSDVNRPLIPIYSAQ